MDQRTVQVATGKVTIRAIGWGTWKKLRTTFATTLKQEQLARLVKTVGELMATADEDDDTPDTGETSVNMLVTEDTPDTVEQEPAGVFAQRDWLSLAPRLVESIADGAGILDGLLAELTEVLVIGGSSVDSIEDMAAVDVLAIRDAVLEENPIGTLLAAEGNLLAGLLNLGQQAQAAVPANGTA